MRWTELLYLYSLGISWCWAIGTENEQWKGNWENAGTTRFNKITITTRKLYSINKQWEMVVCACIGVLHSQDLITTLEADTCLPVIGERTGNAVTSESGSPNPRKYGHLISISWRRFWTIIPIQKMLHHKLMSKSKNSYGKWKTCPALLIFQKSAKISK